MEGTLWSAFTVYGRLMPATDSLAPDAVPIGLAHGIALRNDVAAGQVVTWNDVVVDESNDAFRVRREMEAMFAPPRTSGASQ
jgi:predicted homoserine dehydrogenase-like protein